MYVCVFLGGLFTNIVSDWGHLVLRKFASFLDHQSQVPDMYT